MIIRHVRLENAPHNKFYEITVEEISVFRVIRRWGPIGSTKEPSSQISSCLSKATAEGDCAALVRTKMGRGYVVISTSAASPRALQDRLRRKEADIPSGSTLGKVSEQHDDAAFTKLAKKRKEKAPW
jgi:predicted DNA-binding WGR domain protein